MAWLGQYFEELSNPTNTSTVEKAETQGKLGRKSTSMADLAEVVKKLFSGTAPGGG